jgi:hypothetical protein
VVQVLLYPNPTPDPDVVLLLYPNPDPDVVQVLYPHPRGAPFKTSLKGLAKQFLNEDIQEGEHDSFQVLPEGHYL